MPQIDTLFGTIQYGCVFCRTGQESVVARSLEDQYAGLHATAVTQTRHKSENGRKYTEQKILLPGYVFFRSAENTQIDLRRTESVIRLLRSAEGAWQLQGADAEFAELVFTQGGIFGLSQVRKLGDKVVIISGPLKSMEGNIIKIDRHRRNGQVELRLDDHVWRVWLAFEMLE